MSNERMTSDDNGAGAKQAFAADMESLKNSFTQLRTDLTSLVGNAFGASKSGAGVIREQAGTAADGVKERLVGLKDKSMESAEAIEQRIEQKIIDHPLTSALVAFGAGYILAKLLTRK